MSHTELCSKLKTVCSIANPIQNPGSSEGFPSVLPGGSGSDPSGSTRSLPSWPERTNFW
jgi:hypothetical protein